MELPHSHGNEQRAEALKERLEDSELFQTVADVFKLLDDSSRVRIFWLLCHCEECVINIASMVGMTNPAVSHHLKQLRAGELITSRRDGKEVYYKVADTEQAHLLHKTIEKIMAIICPMNCGKYQSEHVETIRKIHEYILQNMHQRITIEELSRLYLINPTTLKAVFKEVYGNSIAAHMKEHRMEKASHLLTETDDSISDIALAVGYSSQSRFSAAFKEAYQMLPLEYRKLHLKK